MLKTRVTTALVMAVVGLAVLFLTPALVFAVLAGLLLLGLGGWEAGRLAGINEVRHAPAYAAFLLLLGGILLILDDQGLVRALLAGAAALWLGLMLWLARPQAGGRLVAVKLFVLGVIVLAAWLAAVILQQSSPWLVLMLVVIIAGADIGAYFTGRTLGGPKLAPAISPGKTVSGACGGVLTAAAAAATTAWLLPQAPFGIASAALIGVILALLSIGGDLFISLLKRQQGLKDTSSVFPGHGGVLDRFDSLGAALPFFALAWLWWGR